VKKMVRDKLISQGINPDEKLEAPPKDDPSLAGMSYEQQVKELMKRKLQAKGIKMEENPQDAEEKRKFDEKVKQIMKENLKNKDLMLVMTNCCNLQVWVVHLMLKLLMMLK